MLPLLRGVWVRLTRSPGLQATTDGSAEAATPHPDKDPAETGEELTTRGPRRTPLGSQIDRPGSLAEPLATAKLPTALRLSESSPRVATLPATPPAPRADLSQPPSPKTHLQHTLKHSHVYTVLDQRAPPPGCHSSLHVAELHTHY